MTTTNEAKEYDLPGLVRGLGGALSLCLGVSLIMMFELVELAVRLISTSLQNCF